MLGGRQSLLKQLARSSTLLSTSQRGFFFKSETRKPYRLVKPGNVSPQISYKAIPKHVELPPYAITGNVPNVTSPQPKSKTPDEIDRIREACKLARRILVEAGELLRVGLTTEEIDQFVMDISFAHGAYPSPLNYKGFPKAVCTSVNNCVCHGIPDDIPLADGDIINIDITVYLEGVHGDCSETFLVGEVDEKGRRLIDVAKEALKVGVETCKPNEPFGVIGKNIQDYVEGCGMKVVPVFTGHGIGSFFHGPPDIYHVRNTYPGQMKPGMVFTVEPAVSEGDNEVVILEDGWTAVTADNSRSAQFEHTVLITDNGCEVLTK